MLQVQTDVVKENVPLSPWSTFFLIWKNSSPNTWGLQVDWSFFPFFLVTKGLLPKGELGKNTLHEVIGYLWLNYTAHEKIETKN